MNEEVRETSSGSASAPNKKRKKIIIASVAAVLIVAIVIVLVVVLTGGGVNKSSAQLIQIGFTKAETEEALGAATAGGDGDVWEYYDEKDAEKGGSYNYIKVTFSQDSVVEVVFNSTGKDLSGKELQSIALATFTEEDEIKEFYVTMPGEENIYDISYTTEYSDGSFCTTLVEKGVSSESAVTREFSWEDAFGTTSNAGIRFTYPFTVTYVMNGGMNNSGNIAGYSLKSLGSGFTLLAPQENAHEFTDVTLAADGSISCTVIEKNFDGWYSDEKFSERVTQITSDAGDITLYAKWSGEKSRQQYSGENYVRAADTVLFGAYPKTIKADDVTISGSANEQGYYTGSDGNLYAAVTAAPHGSYKFSNGDRVKEGDTYYFKVEPIEWRVLADENGTLTILSDDIVYGMNFDAANAKWDESDVRQWLNEDFFAEAFHAAQAALIEQVTLDNGISSVPVSNTGSNSNICGSTQDKVWLLSYAEVQNPSYGFIGELAQGDSVTDGRDVSRSKTVTDYALACGALQVTGNSDYAGQGSWWLRSAYYGSTSTLKIMCVRSDGYVGVYDDSTLTAGGIVPAIKITLQ